MSKKAYLQEADEKLNNTLNVLAEGVTLSELADILGSEATARRQIARLQNAYDCKITCKDSVYKIELIGKNNMWRRLDAKLIDLRREARLLKLQGLV